MIADIESLDAVIGQIQNSGVRVDVLETLYEAGEIQDSYLPRVVSEYVSAQRFVEALNVVRTHNLQDQTKDVGELIVSGLEGDDEYILAGEAANTFGLYDRAVNNFTNANRFQRAVHIAEENNLGDKMVYQLRIKAIDYCIRKDNPGKFIQFAELLGWIERARDDPEFKDHIKNGSGYWIKASSERSTQSIMQQMRNKYHHQN